MSVCRRALFRVFCPRNVQHARSATRSFSDGPKSPANDSNASTSSQSNSFFSGGADKDPPWEQPTYRILEEVRASIPRGSPKESKKALEKRKMERKTIREALDSYEAARRRNRLIAAQWATSELRALVGMATEAGSLRVVDHIAVDILEVIAHRDKADLWTVATALLRPRPPLLQPNRIMALLSLFEPDPTTPSLKHSSFQCILDSLLAHSDPPISSLLTFAERLIPRLSSSPAPSGVRSITYRPPMIVVSSFHLTRRLLLADEDQKAMHLFTTLVNTRNVPPEAIGTRSSQAQDFFFTIFTVLIRSAIRWNWRNEAHAATVDLLTSERGQKSIHSAIPIALEVMRDLLDEPSCDDITNCRYLICEADARAGDNTMIPEDIIRLFYSKAQLLCMGEEAEQLYAYTQMDAVVEKKPYAPPFGYALTWLLQQLTVKSRKRHLGRQLVNQVLSRNELIPLLDRAQFIALSAMNGYATQARALWNKYSVEKYREAVVGHPVAMLRLVGLFANLITRTHAKLLHLAEGDGKEVGPSGSVKLKGYFTTKRMTSEAKGEKMIPTDVTSADDVPYERPIPIDDEFGGLSRDVYQELLDDFKTFSQCVIEEYRKVHEPLHKAHHYHLNALARAYFMFGNLQAGFDTVRCLLDRKEIPSRHDINVVLGAMAAYDPRGAAKMIDKMIAQGVRPNEVTFGTVLHHAVLHKDMDLVSSLIQQAKQVLGGLSLKMISSLIRYTIARNGRSRAALRLNLNQALKIMRSLMDGSYVVTGDMGKYCIFTSLSVDDPVMAFEFWRMLVKDRTDWRDDEQSFQRRLIAKKIAHHRSAGWLDGKQSSQMLAQLREPEGQGMHDNP